jgi:hypothetical protein
VQINDNPGVTGRLDDKRLLASIQSWGKLKFLELGNLPGLTGPLPQDCPPPFNSLEHLGISNTGVSGALPGCLLNTVHQLEISNTKIAGPFPNFKPQNMIR